MRFTAILAIVALGSLAEAAAQTTPGVPRTTEGRPDFHGVWASRWLTPVERPAGVANLVVDEAGAKELAQSILARAASPSQLDPELAFPDAETLAIVRGEYRSSLVIDPPDGKLPFTDAGRAAGRKYLGGMLDGPEQRMTTERCLGGVGWAPLQIRTASMLRRIVQTQAHVVLHSEAYSDLRILGLGSEATPDGARAATGSSQARWEGDALVVETAHFRPDFATHGIVTVLSAEAHIMERFEYASADELVYRYTVSDPVYYSDPWTVEYSLLRSNEPIFEFACHEGNYSLTHMLAGARVVEGKQAR